uniref:Anaphase-promoting complex subunit 13 n=1 Tax=Rhabditophanes sp. KR3021 TaxID=114890 RepID=A0AC35UEN2_9BILA
MNLQQRNYTLHENILIIDDDWVTHKLKSDTIDVPAFLRPDPEAETVPSGFREQDKFSEGENRWADTGLSQIHFWHAPPQHHYPRNF